MKVRTLIVDDESLARERLRQLLEAEPEVELIGECGDGRTALEVIRKHAPALVFLDIRIPELDGFEVVESLASDPPVIVFVTAYNEFALRAFEVHAVDYLLKPFDRERFQAALRHALEHVKLRAGGVHQQRQAALLADLKSPARPPDRLPIKSAGRILFVAVSDIDWIEAAHNYVEVHVKKQVHLLRETVSAIEAQLPADKFVRISRSVIVNIDRIQELAPLFYGEYRVSLHDGTRLTLSRRYRHKLRQLGLG